MRQRRWYLWLLREGAVRRTHALNRSCMCNAETFHLLANICRGIHRNVNELRSVLPWTCRKVAMPFAKARERPSVRLANVTASLGISFRTCDVVNKGGPAISTTKIRYSSDLGSILSYSTSFDSPLIPISLAPWHLMRQLGGGSSNKIITGHPVLR